MMRKLNRLELYVPDRFNPEEIVSNTVDGFTLFDSVTGYWKGAPESINVIEVWASEEVATQIISETYTVLQRGGEEAMGFVYNGTPYIYDIVPDGERISL